MPHHPTPAPRAFPWKKFLLRGFITLLIGLAGTWIAIDQLGKKKLRDVAAELEALGYETNWEELTPNHDQAVITAENIVAAPIFESAINKWPSSLQLPRRSPDRIEILRLDPSEPYDPRKYFVDQPADQTIDEAVKSLLALNKPEIAAYDDLIRALERPYFHPTPSEGVFQNLSASMSLIYAINTISYQAKLDLMSGNEERAFQGVKAILNADNAYQNCRESHGFAGFMVNITAVDVCDSVTTLAIERRAWSNEQWEFLADFLESIDSRNIIRKVIAGEIKNRIIQAENVDLVILDRAKIREQYSREPTVAEYLKETFFPPGYWHSQVADRIAPIIESNRILFTEERIALNTAPVQLTIELAEKDSMANWLEGMRISPTVLIERGFQMQNTRDGLAIKVALMRYFRANQKWPASLAELAPNYLPEPLIPHLVPPHFNYELIDGKPSLKVQQDISGTRFSHLSSK